MNLVTRIIEIVVVGSHWGHIGVTLLCC